MDWEFFKKDKKKTNEIYNKPCHKNIKQNIIKQNKYDILEENSTGHEKWWKKIFQTHGLILSTDSPIKEYLLYLFGLDEINTIYFSIINPPKQALHFLIFIPKS